MKFHVTRAALHIIEEHTKKSTSTSTERLEKHTIKFRLPEGKKGLAWQIVLQLGITILIFSCIFVSEQLQKEFIGKYLIISIKHETQKRIFLK